MRSLYVENVFIKELRKCGDFEIDMKHRDYSLEINLIKGDITEEDIKRAANICLSDSVEVFFNGGKINRD